MNERDYDPELDCYLSYFEAIREIGHRVKAGMPLPAIFRGRNNGEATGDNAAQADEGRGDSAPADRAVAAGENVHRRRADAGLGHRRRF
jgi:hypothetical protein